LNNLQWLAQEENVERSIGVPVEIYDSNGVLQESSPSITKCAEKFDFGRGKKYHPTPFA
jgi:hypothetical protein